MKNFLKESKNLLLVFLLLDLLVISLYLLFPEKAVFNLDFESNLPTIYQGLKLILTSTISFIILALIYLSRGDVIKNWFWWFWAGMFMFLGLDEIGQIHENISQYVKEIIGSGATEYEVTLSEVGYSSTPWLPYYVFLFVLATVVVLFSLRNFYRKEKKTPWLFVIGWIFFLGVPIVEYINTLPQFMFQEGYMMLVLLEEIFEMLGATFLLSFTYKSLLERFFMIYYKNEISKKHSK